MERKERALIIGVNVNNDPHFEESIKELKNLALACDLEPVGEVLQNLPKVHTGHYVGSGKLEEISRCIDSEEIDVVVFEDELTPSQMRNLGKLLSVEILDRTRLILEIFARRSKTREAKLQVEVANLKYILPRLRDSNQNFNRQRGGGLKNRGAGETKLELDRRKLEIKISEMEKELKSIALNREVRRKRRQQSGVPLVALVGYTNAGKSTLMNAMIKKYHDVEDKLVFEKDMLFATLETAVRHIQFGDGKRILLSDTVGFIHKLPHHLVRAFHSTLEEVKEADLLLHVVDCSNPNYEKHLAVTHATLDMLGATHIDQLIVYNKIDVLNDDITLPHGNDHVSVSAKKDVGFSQLIALMMQQLFKANHECQLLIPHEKSQLISDLKVDGTLLDIVYVEKGALVTAELSKHAIERYQAFIHQT
ncbi:MAG: GTPase HflX [Defluviitaleaceae bacterium]|nr:GTPase HflX [Defluviitaleaceae bacterium]